MSFGFLNALMLVGLAGLALPVLVHLISKRKFDVVQWGAMQFLELGRRTRRRFRIEELLLLLLRMSLLGLVALAVARPWVKGGPFHAMSGNVQRDVALVVDGSYSMGWEGRAVTPYAAAGQWAHRLLDDLGSGDSVILLDARDRIRPVIEAPTGDLGLVRRELDQLPEPSGTSHLAEAALKAAQLLAGGNHLQHDIILLTDGQALGWSPENEQLWKQFDDVLGSAPIRPRVWAVDVDGEQAAPPVNFSVGPLTLSRELTVPGFPIRIETTVRQSGGEMSRRQVSLEVDGTRLDEKSLSVDVPGDGEAAVAFEHRFAREGSHVVSVSVTADELPGDNRSQAVVLVETGMPVLLVDGDPRPDPTQSETFFLRSALSPAGSESPWVRTRVVRWDQFSEDSLQGQSVVILANVPSLTDPQIAALLTFVSDGGGLIVAPGDRIDAGFYNERLAGDEQPLLPATFGSIENDTNHALGDVNVSGESLAAAWLTRFGTAQGIDLLNARFSHWWKLIPRSSESTLNGEGDSPDADSVPIVRTLAALDTGDPWLIGGDFGRGHVLQLAVPLDGDWSTLPARNDFVPLLHEMIFHLAARAAGRTVVPGMPLLMDIAPDQSANDFRFIDPDGREYPAEPAGDEARPRVRCSHTALAGVYRCVQPGVPGPEADYFVVVSDRAESDLTPLTAADRERLAGNDRVRFISGLEEMRAELTHDQPPSEMWRWLLLAVLGLLVLEVLLTRRLVQGGHELVDDAVPGESPSLEPSHATG